MIGTRFSLLLAVLPRSPSSRPCIPRISKYLGTRVSPVRKGFSRRIRSPQLKSQIIKETEEEENERIGKEGKGLCSKKTNLNTGVRLGLALPLWSTLFRSSFLSFVLMFSSFLFDFSNGLLPLHTGWRGREERRAEREIHRKESEGWKGGMQRWKRVVVISSFGREQIIKHFLKPISALMYVCVRVYVCLTVTTDYFSLTWNTESNV